VEKTLEIAKTTNQRQKVLFQMGQVRENPDKRHTHFKILVGASKADQITNRYPGEGHRATELHRPKLRA
jgi:hypothetical protein